MRGKRQTDVTGGRASQGDGAPGRPDGRGRPDGAGSRPDGLGDDQEERRTITWRRDGGGRRGERGPAGRGLGSWRRCSYAGERRPLCQARCAANESFRSGPVGSAVGGEVRLGRRRRGVARARVSGCASGATGLGRGGGGRDRPGVPAWHREVVRRPLRSGTSTGSFHNFIVPGDRLLACLFVCCIPSSGSGSVSVPCRAPRYCGVFHICSRRSRGDKKKKKIKIKISPQIGSWRRPGFGSCQGPPKNAIWQLAAPGVSAVVPKKGGDSAVGSVIFGS